MISRDIFAPQCTSQHVVVGTKSLEGLNAAGFILEDINLLMTKLKVSHSPISGGSLCAVPRLLLHCPTEVFFSLAQTKEKALGFQNSLHAQQETTAFPTGFSPALVSWAGVYDGSARLTWLSWVLMQL